MKRLIVMACTLVQVLTILANAPDQTTRLTFTGDIMMGTTFPSIQLPPQEGKQLFADAAPILLQSDLAFGNLEGTFCDEGTTKKEISPINYAFATPTHFSPRLKEAGFDFMSMANNHAFDFGKEGVLSTMQCLDRIGIKYAGLSGFVHQAVIEKDGIRYGICAFGHNSYTLRHQDLKNVGRIISQLVDNTDIVIVSFHGGGEGVKYTRLPYGKETFLEEDRGNLREFAHFCIDAGADIVYGHGPHVVRAIELYKDHLIAYSLGNFCTPYGINVSGIAGYAPILEVKVNKEGKFINGKLHSFIQHRGVGPRLDVQNKAAKEIRRLTRLDIPNTPLRISDNGDITVNRPIIPPPFM